MTDNFQDTNNPVQLAGCFFRAALGYVHRSRDGGL